MKFSEIKTIQEGRSVSFMPNFTSLSIQNLKDIAGNNSAAQRIEKAIYVGFNNSEKSFNYVVDDDLEYRVFLNNSGNPTGIFKGR